MTASADAFMGIFGFKRVEGEQMKTIEETRRELFEAKFPPPYYISWNVDRSGYYSIHRDSTRKRHAECYDAKWEGFSAALDAVVIELPPANCEGPSYDSYLAMDAEEVRAAIESTGLGLKVKS